MKIMLKVAAIPIIMILGILKVILDLGLKGYCLGACVIVKLLALCVILSLCTCQWKNLGVFLMLAGIGAGITFLIMLVIAQVDIMKDSLIGFMKG